MIKKRNYSLLLESRGVARFQRRVKDETELERLKKLTSHLASINGKSDDRREIKDAPAQVRELAKSVALLCDVPLKSAHGMWKLPTEPVGLLSGETFSEQLKVPDGFTGFLVGEDLLLTTAHDVSVDRLRIVFDFVLDANNVPKTTYSNDEVFKVKEVVDHRHNENTGEDWLLLRLDRSPGRPSWRIESQAAPVGSQLQMLGHPLGLPMKYVDNAKVTKTGNAIFECDLDASWGNSGSPVWSSGAVVGVLQGTAPGVDDVEGLWLWCPTLGNCPTVVTSSPAFAPAVAAAAGP